VLNLFFVIVGSVNGGESELTALIGRDHAHRGWSVAHWYFLLICRVSAPLPKYLLIPNVPGAGELIIFCGRAGLVAGLGFLWFNTYPPQVFMGDVGALALGAALGYPAVIVRQEISACLSWAHLFVETLFGICPGRVHFQADAGAPGCFAWRHSPPIFELKGGRKPRVTCASWILP